MGRSSLGIGSDDEESGSLGHGAGGSGIGAATVTGVCPTGICQCDRRLNRSGSRQ